MLVLGTMASTAGASPTQTVALGSGSSSNSSLGAFTFHGEHLYVKPDLILHGRSLVALANGNGISESLRSVFRQMGASVSYDPAAGSTVISKPGSEVRLTAGHPGIIINGELRPLITSAERDHGTFFLPMRVVSEAMGADLQ